MSFPMVQTCAIIFSRGCAQGREAKLNSFMATIIHHAAIFTFRELKSCPFWQPLGHIDPRLRAWRASWVHPHKHTYTKHTHTHTHARRQLLQSSCLGTPSERESNGCSDRTHSETLPKASVYINLDIPTPAEPLSEFPPDLTHASDKAGVGRATEESASRGPDQAAPPGRRLWQLPLRQ